MDSTLHATRWPRNSNIRIRILPPALWDLTLLRYPPEGFLHLRQTRRRDDLVPANPPRSPLTTPHGFAQVELQRSQDVDQ